MYSLVYAYGIWTACFLVSMLIPITWPFYILGFVQVISIFALIYLLFFTFTFDNRHFSEKLLWGVLFLLSMGLLYPFAFKSACPSFKGYSEKQKSKAQFAVFCMSCLTIITFIVKTTCVSLLCQSDPTL